MVFNLRTTCLNSLSSVSLEKSGRRRWLLPSWAVRDLTRGLHTPSNLLTKRVDASSGTLFRQNLKQLSKCNIQLSYPTDLWAVTCPPSLQWKTTSGAPSSLTLASSLWKEATMSSSCSPACLCRKTDITSLDQGSPATEQQKLNPNDQQLILSVFSSLLNLPLSDELTNLSSLSFFFYLSSLEHQEGVHYIANKDAMSS